MIEKVAKTMPLPDWVNKELKKRNIKICDYCNLMIKDKSWVEVDNGEEYHCECFYKNYTPIEEIGEC